MKHDVTDPYGWVDAAIHQQIADTTSSWWLTEQAEGFTKRAERELMRMSRSKFSAPRATQTSEAA